jgi:hypothetical protein
MKVPFNHPYMTGQELEYIAQAYNLHKLSGNCQIYSTLSKIAPTASWFAKSSPDPFMYRCPRNGQYFVRFTTR